jgi:hypothetical protein
MLSVTATALALAVLTAPAAGQAPIVGAPGQQTEAPPADKAAADKAAADKAVADRKAAADKAEADKRKAVVSYLGEFETRGLAGGTVNELKIPVQPSNLQQLPEDPKIKWEKTGYEKSRFWNNMPVCPEWIDSAKSSEKNETDAQTRPERKPSENIYVRSKRPVDNENAKTVLTVQIPPPPCWWPLNQDAKITIKGNVVGVNGVQTFFEELVSVSVFWFPFVLTVVVLALIYPGCAMAAYYLGKRRFEKDCEDAKKKGEPTPDKPTFWGTLDPVQITANPHGSGSLAKLQIFVFSLLVFGLLLYYQFRYGILAGMPSDVMYLMGISAVGAVGGKLIYAKKRRLSLENWAWLRRKGWIPARGDVQSRAKWSELFLDGDTKEFDPYSFQMAVFSLVVAVGLVRSGLGGLGTFKIPAELLQLLGLSQVVFIGGKAAETSPYEELEKQLKEVQKHETEYLKLKDEKDAEKHKVAEAELKAFTASVAQAATMFWSIYVEQLPEKPKSLAPEKLETMQPGVDPVVPPS